MQIIQNRGFPVSDVAAGTAGAVGGWNSSAAQPLDPATVRFAKAPGTCIVPQYLAGELRAEGSTDVRYATDAGVAQTEMLASGDLKRELKT